MSGIFWGALKGYNLILVLGIGNNVNYNSGCLYRAESAYIAHFTCLYRLYIFILEINVIG